MSSETHLVFVYGTLRSGASNAFRMEGAEFVQEGFVRGRLYRIDWYPGLVLDEKANWVAGEFWRLNSEKLRELDAFEGVPAGAVEGEEYRRIVFSPVAPCESDPGLGKEAWLWEFKGDVDGRELISSGDWLNQVPGEGGRIAWTLGGCLVMPSIPIGALVLFSVANQVLNLEVGRATALLVLSLLCVAAGGLGAYCARHADRVGEGLLFLRFMLYVGSIVFGILGAISFVNGLVG